MMKNAEAQNLLDNAYLFTYKALVKCFLKTVVAHAHALLYRSGKIANLPFWLILSAFHNETTPAQ